MGLNTVPCAPRLVLKALGARTSMASRRARKVGEQVRQCALRMRAPLRANCDEGPVRCHVQNAPFFTPMVHVSPTYGARDVRVGLLSEQGTGGAGLRIAPSWRSPMLTADGAWEVRIVVWSWATVLPMYAISTHPDALIFACFRADVPQVDVFKSLGL